MKFDQPVAGTRTETKDPCSVTPLLLFRKYLTFHKPVEQFSFASGWEGGSLGTGSGRMTLWAFRPTELSGPE